MIVKAEGTGELPQEKETTMAISSSLIQLLRSCNSFLVQGAKSTTGSTTEHNTGFRRGKEICQPEVGDFSRRIRILSSIPQFTDNGSLKLRFYSHAFYLLALLGVRAFGVHIMGYTRVPEDGSMKIWVQKRSLDKPTYPGMMDTMVGGGITAGLQPFQVMLKEAHEEAAIPENIAKMAQAAGTVTFFTETERGLHANTEFVYDLELPPDFVPCNNDGEVEGFEAVSVEEFLECVTSIKYKLTSVPVGIDFLVRHGFITPETEPEYPALVELLHAPLDQLYRRWPQRNSPRVFPIN
nr:uncharacterized protein LOC128705215 [Cherax quadricarinatus]